MAVDDHTLNYNELRLASLEITSGDLHSIPRLIVVIDDGRYYPVAITIENEFCVDEGVGPVVDSVSIGDKSSPEGRGSNGVSARIVPESSQREHAPLLGVVSKGARTDDGGMESCHREVRMVCQSGFRSASSKLEKVWSTLPPLPINRQGILKGVVEADTLPRSNSLLTPIQGGNPSYKEGANPIINKSDD